MKRFGNDTVPKSWNVELVSLFDLQIDYSQSNTILQLLVMFCRCKHKLSKDSFK